MLQFQHYLPNMKVITKNDSMKRKAVQYLDSCIDTFIQKYFMISLRDFLAIQTFRVLLLRVKFCQTIMTLNLHNFKAYLQIQFQIHKITIHKHNTRTQNPNSNVTEAVRFRTSARRHERGLSEWSELNDSGPRARYTLPFWIRISNAYVPYSSIVEWIQYLAHQAA